MPIITTFYGKIELSDTYYFPYVKALYVYGKYRRKGYGYKLMKFLPAKCYLEAIPFGSNTMSANKLRQFYRKHGFRFFKSPISNAFVGFRGFIPTREFWNDYHSGLLYLTRDSKP